MDPRYKKLAQILCRYSMSLEKGDRVLVDAIAIPEEMLIALIREAKRCGADVFVETYMRRVRNELLRNASRSQLLGTQKWDLLKMQHMTAYCLLAGYHNMSEGKDISVEQAAMEDEIFKPILDYRVNKTKWVVSRWPTSAMAQNAKMSTESFEKFFFKVCTLSYDRMVEGATALETVLKNTDRVHINGPGKTDVQFSIKGVGAEKCIGKCNIPDGEVFSAPVKNSIEGVIQFNTPTIYEGKQFDNICLEFKAGKIVKATCEAGDNAALNKILDRDAGARFIGEFALGFNPHIKKPMCDILFDEKIAGSLHMTPGDCYEDAPNGNKSAIHWDLVLIQRPEYGGGEIYFDGKLIRKNGLFIPEALQKLNPKYLLQKPGKTLELSR